MQEAAIEDDIEALKNKLATYSKDDLKFNEPHFTNQLRLREGSRDNVINHLLNPVKLVYSYQEVGIYGDTVHCLHFDVSNTKTIKLPVIFDTGNKKGLYIITYIMRYRPWHNMMIKQGGLK